MKLIQPKHKLRTSRRGQVLLEAAVAVTFLLLPMVLGLIQFGIFYNATNSLSEVAREAGRQTAVWGHTPTGVVNTEYSDDYITSQTRLAAQDAGLLPPVGSSSPSPIFDVEFYKDDGTKSERADRTQFGPVTVTVSYDLSSKSFFPFWKPGLVTRSSYVMCQN